MSAIAIRAFAKINLDLRVLHRRADGYHEIRTIFQTITLHDTLVFARQRGSFAIHATGESVPLDDTNLVWRAARAVWRAQSRRGEPQGVHVRLIKRIPLQAGLGGGSSDAAASLVALNSLWRAGLDRRRLHALAASLGSDVPFFLVGGTALGVGRGEAIFPLPRLGGRYVVIARPDEGVSTVEAYRWLQQRDPHRRVLPQPLEVPWPPGIIDVANDFEAVVCPKRPRIARVLRSLRANGSEIALMAGSGSAAFGLFRERRAAGEAARKLEGPGVRVWLARLRLAGPAPIV